MDEALSGAYGGLFPRRNSFIYPKEAVARGLFENFPHIASASVSRGSFQELFINIQERAPAYLWCGDAPPPSGATASGCYFLDSQGVVFAKSPYFSGSVYFEMYGALTAENVFAENHHASPIGFLFLPSADWSRVIAFRNSIRESEMPPEKFVLKDEGDAEFIFQNGTRLIFSLQENFDVVLENLLAAIDTKPLSKEVFAGQEKVFEYADARFENRIFYK